MKIKIPKIHSKTLGRIWLIVGVLHGVLAGFIFNALVHPDELKIWIHMIIFMMIFGLPGIIGGIALIKQYKWTRVYITIISILYMTSIPIGTIFGAYSIWHINKKEDIINS